MSERHRAAVDELVRLHGDDPEKLALVLCGSLATGKARENSDVDLYLVVTDEAFERIRRTDGCFYGSWDPRAFGGVEIDGKIVGRSFLVEAAARGSEPTRASFEGAYAELSRDPEIERLLPRIAAYPEWERDRKLRTFWAFTKHYRYVGEQAFELGDEYFARRCALEQVFFAARLALAHNRVLFPSHKALFPSLERCAELPPGFVTSSLRLLESPAPAGAIAHYETTAGFFGRYDYRDQERISFILENEWSWFSGLPSAADL